MCVCVPTIVIPGWLSSALTTGGYAGVILLMNPDVPNHYRVRLNHPNPLLMDEKIVVFELQDPYARGTGALLVDTLDNGFCCVEISSKDEQSGEPWRRFLTQTEVDSMRLVEALGQPPRYFVGSAKETDKPSGK
jgi:hypothetical protein